MSDSVSIENSFSFQPLAFFAKKSVLVLWLHFWRLWCMSPHLSQNVSYVKFMKFIELNTMFAVSLILKVLLTRTNQTKTNRSWVIWNFWKLSKLNVRNVIRNHYNRSMCTFLQLHSSDPLNLLHTSRGMFSCFLWYKVWHVSHSCVTCINLYFYCDTKPTAFWIYKIPQLWKSFLEKRRKRHFFTSQEMIQSDPVLNTEENKKVHSHPIFINFAIHTIFLLLTRVTVYL